MFYRGYSGYAAKPISHSQTYAKLLDAVSINACRLIQKFEGSHTTSYYTTRNQLGIEGCQATPCYLKLAFLKATPCSLDAMLDEIDVLACRCWARKGHSKCCSFSDALHNPGQSAEWIGVSLDPHQSTFSFWAFHMFSVNDPLSAQLRSAMNHMLYIQRSIGNMTFYSSVKNPELLKHHE